MQSSTNPFFDIDLILFRAKEPLGVLKGKISLLPFSVGLDRFRGISYIFIRDLLVVLRGLTLLFD